MKNSIIKSTSLICFIVTFSGCATDQQALDFYNNPNVSAHNQSYSGSTLITAIPGNQALISSQDSRMGSSIGKSHQYTVLGFISFGKGMADAANDAGIHQVTSVERNTEISIFPFFKKSTITVTGESNIINSTQFSPNSKPQRNNSPNTSINSFYPSR
jgi:hypothetical protein